jgi:hypothetical protein
MSYWQGGCCSFQDVEDDGTGILCELTVVFSCGWSDPLLECAADATTCTYTGRLASVIEKAECPESIYDAFASTLDETMEPAMSPIPEETMSPTKPSTNSTTLDETMEPTKSPVGAGTTSDSWSCATSYAKILAGVIVLVFLV